MKSTLKAIHGRMSADMTLIALLAQNPPYFDKDGTVSRVNSIIPVPFATANTNTPFISVQEGVANKLGYKLRDETFYIRVYNSKEKSSIEINEIAERLITLLDEQIFQLDEHSMVKTLYESSLAFVQDQALEKNFRELHFRIILL